MKLRFRHFPSLLLLLALSHASAAETALDTSARPFVPLAPEDLLAMKMDLGALGPEDRSYLGVKGSGAQGILQIPAPVVLLEFMNVHCPACGKQASILNEAYEVVQRRQDLRGRVRFLAVSVGNSPSEVEKFRRENRIPFPVLPDPLFSVYDSVGSPEGLPFLIAVTLRPPGGQVAARGHLGWVEAPEKVVAELEHALTARPPGEAERMAAYRLGEWRNLKLNVAESYLRKLLIDAAGDVGMRNPSVEQVEAGKGDVVYRLSSNGDRRLWAKVAGRVKICNACENIYFIILFDDQGKVFNFTPVKVTKGYNLRWDENDVAFMNSRLVGRSVLEPRPFDPEVDSVTSATMSADLIFDTVRRLGGTYQALKEKGLIP